VFYSFHCGGLSPPWLGLLLDISFHSIFWGYCERGCLPDFFLNKLVTGI
jgi:hypothetical protein